MTPGSPSLRASAEPLRVAMIVHKFPVMSETFVLNQAAGILERGHDLHLFAFESIHTDGAHDVVKQFDLYKRLRILDEPPAFWRRTVRAPKTYAAIARIDRPHAHNAINVRRHGRAAASLRLLHFATATAGLPPFDVVHCQFGSLWHVGMLMARLAWPKSGLVVSFRGRDISAYIRQHGQKVYAPLFAEADRFLPNCEYFAGRLREIGAPAERVCVVRSGLDLRHFPYRERRLEPGQPVRLLTIGRLVEKKGIEYALRAVATLVRAGHEITYTIVGEGPLREALKNLARELEAADRIHFAGAMNHEALRGQLDTHHILLATSVTAADGDEDAPVNVLKEAMASGMPVIATNHGGIPELVEDGVNGYLVPERDTEAVAQALQRLLADPDSWPALGQRGRSTVAERYEQGKQTDLLEQVYREVSATRRAQIC